ncbi:flavin-containing monooxygenase [Candidatus Poriferisocius sp.]|uniref:flavin-containing monooxygenase n=1 Tax=Candidatus Poriferisocius sp. TaxID=3101276 RepID=UPI003B018B76
MSTNGRHLPHFDAVVIGAGFAGLYMLHKLRQLGLTARVYETGDDVGGTWYWNRYPGARCDVESLEYCYSFDPELEQEWEWTERYPAQPEILLYAQHVAERYDLYRDIQFNTKVTEAVFEEGTGRWRVSSSVSVDHIDHNHAPVGTDPLAGEVGTDADLVTAEYNQLKNQELVLTGTDADLVTAEYLITAVGCLSSSNVPDIDGIDTFEGELHHTGRYPKEGIDFSGRRVGVIGTGSSGIQAIPVIAEAADHLIVFQRTPQYAVPARNHPLDPREQAEVKADYRRLREQNRAQYGALGARFDWNEGSVLEVDLEEATREFESRWEIGGFAFLGAYSDIARTPEANNIAADFIKDKIRETVNDPEVAERLIPTTHVGCKRLVLDTGYFETYNRDNVTLVDINESPILEITTDGLRTADGIHHDLDVIVFATGYDAMTGSLLRMDIRGRGGLSLAEQWYGGPRTYLGLSVPGFPNMFTITGPGSPSVLANMIVCIEQHVDWIGNCIDYLRGGGYRFIEATEEATDGWVEHVNLVAGHTLYPTCNSWYLGANIPGKTRVFMPLPGFPAYAEKCEQVAAAKYEGFNLAR